MAVIHHCVPSQCVEVNHPRLYLPMVSSSIVPEGATPPKFNVLII